MRRASLFLLAAVLFPSGNSSGEDAKKEDGVKEEMKRLSGLWLLDRTENGDFTTTVNGFFPALFLEGDKVTQGRMFPGEKEIDKSGSGTFKIDASKTPKTIDITLKEGEKETTQLGIYKLDGDALVISLAEAGAKERPKDFDKGKAPIDYYFRAKR